MSYGVSSLPMKVLLIFPSCDIMDTKPFKSTMQNEKQGCRESVCSFEIMSFVYLSQFRVYFSHATGRSLVSRAQWELDGYTDVLKCKAIEMTKVRGFKNKEVAHWISPPNFWLYCFDTQNRITEISHGSTSIWNNVSQLHHKFWWNFSPPRRICKA